MSTTRDEAQGKFLRWCANGKLKKVKAFQKKDPSAFRRAVKYVDNVGYTALTRASMNGHAKVVSLLISNGADIDAANTEEGYTALMHAALAGRSEVVSLLLSSGAIPFPFQVH